MEKGMRRRTDLAVDLAARAAALDAGFASRKIGEIIAPDQIGDARPEATGTNGQKGVEGWALDSSIPCGGSTGFTVQ
jgi:hypothetical protein